MDIEIFHSIPHGIFTIDENGRITSFNHAAEQITGFSAAEAVGKRCNDVFEGIVSKNLQMQKIKERLPLFAASPSTVLIEGASGTGKDLVARAIHNLSPRKDGPFITVNCSALPDNLLESELFGYVKGAFTDAKKDKPGRFQLAHTGTILLDEIGEISPIL